MSVEAAAHDRVKYTLTIKRNERSPSREIDAHNQRNAQRSGNTLATGIYIDRIEAWSNGDDTCPI